MYVPIEDNPDIDWRINEGNQFTIYFHVDWTFPGDTVVFRLNEDRIQLMDFPLENIDAMREKILATPKTTELVISNIAEGYERPHSLAYYHLRTNGANVVNGVCLLYTSRCV